MNAGGVLTGSGGSVWGGKHAEVKGLKAFSQKLQQHMDSFGLDSEHLFLVAPHKAIIILGLAYCLPRNIGDSCRGCCTRDRFPDRMGTSPR